jgi:hypothetical protein
MYSVRACGQYGDSSISTVKQVKLNRISVKVRDESRRNVAMQICAARGIGSAKAPRGPCFSKAAGTARQDRQCVTYILFDTASTITRQALAKAS